MNALPLAGRAIVVTRPAGQAAALAEAIRSRGGHAIVFPTLEILELEDRRALEAVLARLDAFDFAIFVSPNAVDRACAAMRAHGPLPLALPVAAVGRGSARSLRKLGFRTVIAPDDGADSESLLALPALQAVAGKRVVIFRGVGGRELLAGTLKARGAHITYAECYRRGVPEADTSVLSSAWERNALDAIVATSSEGLRNLHAMLDAPARARLAATALFVPHPRIAETARGLGVGAVYTTGAGDARIVETLVRHFAPVR